MNSLIHACITQKNAAVRRRRCISLVLIDGVQDLDEWTPCYGDELGRSYFCSEPQFRNFRHRLLIKKKKKSFQNLCCGEKWRCDEVIYRASEGLLIKVK